MGRYYPPQLLVSARRRDKPALAGLAPPGAAAVLTLRSNWSRARTILAWLRSAQSPSAETGCNRSRPSAVKPYSTRGGTVGKTERVIKPSRSSPRSVSVSMRCEMPPIERRNSLKRKGPPPSRVTTRTDHLSPTRASTSLTARQSAGKCLCLGFMDVPTCPLGHLFAPSYDLSVPKLFVRISCHFSLSQISPHYLRFSRSYH